MLKIKETFEGAFEFEQDGTIFNNDLLSGMLKDDPLRDDAIKSAG